SGVWRCGGEKSGVSHSTTRRQGSSAEHCTCHTSETDSSHRFCLSQHEKSDTQERHSACVSAPLYSDTRTVTSSPINPLSTNPTPIP
ncbi:hypothetical protein EJ03DRAFT_289585, partial [Teratosphaeria nubilosa]